MKYIKDNMDEVLKALHDNIDNLKNRADTVIAPVKEFKPYIKLDDKAFQWSLYCKNTFGTFGLRTEYYFKSDSRFGSSNISVDAEKLSKVLAHFDKVKDDWLKQNESTIEENKAIAKHNKEQKEKVHKIMTTLGVRGYTTSEYKTARSRKKTTTSHPAGYIEDLNRTCKTECSLKSSLFKIKDLRDKIERFGLKHIKDTAKKVEEDIKKKKEEVKAKTMAALRLKYTPDNFASSEDEILSNMLDKCKYLSLAHYLYMNRCSWVDGYSYAETGLNNFSADCDVDMSIYSEISEIIHGEDVDGRYFRDCKYNYDIIFGMANQELKADYDVYCEQVDLF